MLLLYFRRRGGPLPALQLSCAFMYSVSAGSQCIAVQAEEGRLFADTDCQMKRTYQRRLMWPDWRLRSRPRDRSRSELSARERPGSSCKKLFQIELLSVQCPRYRRPTGEAHCPFSGFGVLPGRDHSTTAFVFSRSVFSQSMRTLGSCCCGHL